MQERRNSIATNALELRLPGTNLVPLGSGNSVFRAKPLPKSMVIDWLIDWLIDCELPLESESQMTPERALTGPHFTNDFSIVIQIQWKIGFSVTSMLSIISLQNFAHATSAQLSWHVQNFYNLDESRMIFPTNLNNDGKIVREMGPSIECDVTVA